MNLLLIRHSHAGTREEWQKSSSLSDNFRPLTKQGLVQFSKTTRGLTHIIKNIDLIYTSQLTRALQTSEILHGEYSQSSLVINKNLNPDGNTRSLILSLNKIKKSEVTTKTVALVGHNPDIGILTNQLLGLDSNLCLFAFKKGSIAYLDFSQNVAKLNWLMTQEQVANQIIT